MDLVAAVAAAFALLLSAQGYSAAGAALYAGALVGFPVALARRPGLPLILPFSFASYFVVLILAFGGFALLRESASAQAACMGVLFYYYACVSLREKKARYSSGGWFTWQTVTSRERPRVYRALVALFFVLAAVPLGLVFAAVSGWLPRTAS